MKPPRWAQKLLNWWGDPNTQEEVQGDLLELYTYWVQTVGERNARWRYVLSVLKLMRPLAKRQFNEQYPSPFFLSPTMLRNYLKFALRNLVKNKAYSAINIGGLAVGMAVAVLNGLWIWDELSFDTYHQNYDRIAQVMVRTNDDGKPGVNRTLQYPLATELKTNYQQDFKHIVIASWVQEYILSAGENKVSRTGQFVEDGTPEMLTLKMIYGSWNGLKDPHSILLSASTAKALFGDADPINEVVKINNKTDVKVTGVYADLPHNTKFHEIKFFSPWDLFATENRWVKESALHDWGNHFLNIYAEIKPTTNFNDVSTRIKDAELKNLTNFKEQAALKPQVFLQPMSLWHLYSKYDVKKGTFDTEPARLVWLVGIIGAFVLLLACINFMNLSTARSEKRAKEVGIRKAVGSVRGQLISQFFSESFLVVFLAFGLTILLVTLSLSWFNELAAKEMVMPWANPWFWLISAGFISLTGLLAGSYPALYLSSFQPVKVLKGIMRSGRSISTPRRILVVVQFTVSVTLIISTIIVYRQIQYAKNRPVGYTRDGLITMEMKSGDFYGKYDLLRTELKNMGVVAEMSESMGKVTEVWSGNGGFNWRGKDPKFEDSFGTLAVTADHGKTVGWQFVAGRDFSRQFSTDSSGIVINESAVKYMGLKKPIGEPVSWVFQGKKIKDYRVLGVIKDMVMASPYEPIEPTIFFIDGHAGVNWINIKINPGVSPSDALPKIEAVFKKLVPSAPFDYKFVDQDYALKFAAEERIGKLAGFFAILAIFISCLGLFGLASFMAEQRTKEIGIRKVLGASVLNLWSLLSKDFVYLVIVAFGIATPIAYYFLSNWLQKYTYRTEISWWIFAASGAGALVITLLTVSFQSIKAALMNPVRSLRSE